MSDDIEALRLFELVTLDFRLVTDDATGTEAATDACDCATDVVLEAIGTDAVVLTADEVVDVVLEAIGTETDAADWTKDDCLGADDVFDAIETDFCETEGTREDNTVELADGAFDMLEAGL